MAMNSCIYDVANKLVKKYPILDDLGINSTELRKFISTLLERDEKEIVDIQIVPDFLDLFFRSKFVKIVFVILSYGRYNYRINKPTITHIDTKYIGDEYGELIGSYFVLVTFDNGYGPGHYYIIDKPCFRANKCEDLIKELETHGHLRNIAL
jgi:hypothetical protein